MREIKIDINKCKYHYDVFCNHPAMTRIICNTIPCEHIELEENENNENSELLK